jgi:hypothetical protein
MYNLKRVVSQISIKLIFILNLSIKMWFFIEIQILNSKSHKKILIDAKLLMIFENLKEKFKWFLKKTPLIKR